MVHVALALPGRVMHLCAQQQRHGDERAAGIMAHACPYTCCNTGCRLAKPSPQDLQAGKRAIPGRSHTGARQKGQRRRTHSGKASLVLESGSSV